ncbi:MAG: nitrogenase-stabilizing/protective protein NifW [Cyanobacteriota bacterium]|nr:nitrogenase-stabilizing/protective protein NifW [Cyanobacteriota bacterium]
MTSLNYNLAQFNRLQDAEDYFAFFSLPYDPQVVNVNRLHILRKFSELVEDVDTSQEEDAILSTYREALETAYNVFLESSSVEQKLFKVFKDRPKNVVMLSDIGVE